MLLYVDGHSVGYRAISGIRVLPGLRKFGLREEFSVNFSGGGAAQLHRFISLSNVCIAGQTYVIEWDKSEWRFVFTSHLSLH